MLGWFAAPGLLGLARGMWIAIVAIVIAAAIAIANNAVEDVLDTARAAGGSEVRADHAQATIEQAEKANEAAEDLRRDAGVADDECLRNARNPADC